ncbi:hypothetical protein DICPUDRAFT_152758 [Dictyostelium purpureum]|uniref:Uncharacterized protein n=1 Tax=Dictyostelium purpureum TaxID=5786 RepID=F0ZM74_DICPU|nr:uncharacterized protein DICPUDRAFT_152758 [Dictyostelium purpureum]EGC34935.1 hypothetical protein DICPUDRAFT_152758 [Dictyostelium purpureum]|eukprot:XP_003288516.1 hypothetical protein DICPUDRAFT_152758 [Dictyostelium purpureum]
MEKHYRIVKLITFIINNNVTGDLLNNVQLSSSFPYAERYLAAAHASVAPVSSCAPVAPLAPVAHFTPVVAQQIPLSQYLSTDNDTPSSTV